MGLGQRWVVLVVQWSSRLLGCLESVVAGVGVELCVQACAVCVHIPAARGNMYISDGLMHSSEARASLQFWPIYFTKSEKMRAFIL